MRVGGPSAGGGWLLVCELVSCWAVDWLHSLCRARVLLCGVVADCWQEE